MCVFSFTPTVNKKKNSIWITWWDKRVRFVCVCVLTCFCSNTKYRETEWVRTQGHGSGVMCVSQTQLWKTVAGVAATPILPPCLSRCQLGTGVRTMCLPFPRSSGRRPNDPIPQAKLALTLLLLLWDHSEIAPRLAISLWKICPACPVCQLRLMTTQSTFSFLKTCEPNLLKIAIYNIMHLFMSLNHLFLRMWSTLKKTRSLRWKTGRILMAMTVVSHGTVMVRSV